MKILSYLAFWFSLNFCLIFPIALGVSDALGDTPKAEMVAFKVNHKNIWLVHDNSQHLMVSTNCLLRNKENWEKNERCEAIQKLKEVSFKKLLPNLVGGANPGSVACLKWGGKSFLALDSKSNENSLCQFSDGSIASTGTLHFYAQQNDRLPVR